MKKYFRLAIIVLLSIPSCEKNITDDINHDQIKLDLVKLDKFIIDNYYKDAKRIYYKEIFEDSLHFNRNNPVLDTSEITKVLKIIQTVYDLGSQESKDIFDVYKIHPRICINSDFLWLEVDPTAPEIINLSKAIIPTGNQSLDKLLTTYEFKSVKKLFSSWLFVYFNKEYNLIPVADEFLEIPSIKSNFWDSCGGDGGDIFLTRNQESAKIIFSYGEGDCPSGCLYHKYWEFQVRDNKASFVKSYEN